MDFLTLRYAFSLTSRFSASRVLRSFLRVLRVIHPRQDFQSLHCYIPNVQSLIIVIPIRFLPNACPATQSTSQSMDGLGCLVRQLSYESPVLVAGYERRNHQDK